MVLIGVGTLLYYFPGLIYWAWCAVLLLVNFAYSIWFFTATERDIARYADKPLKFEVPFLLSAFAVLGIPSIFNVILMNYYLWTTVVLPIQLAAYFYMIDG